MVETILLIAAVVLAAVAVALATVSLLRKPQKPDLSELERRVLDELRLSRQETAASVTTGLQNAAQTQAAQNARPKYDEYVPSNSETDENGHRARHERQPRVYKAKRNDERWACGAGSLVGHLTHMRIV